MNFNRKTITYFIWILFSLNTIVIGWQKKIEFNFKLNNISDDNEFREFESVYFNRDYFSLLSSNHNSFFEIDNESILIGARNHLYQLKLPDLTVLSDHTWSSVQTDKNKCLSRSIIINKDECDNYIKLYLKINNQTFKICSTNALSPKCRFYNFKNNKFENSIIINETSGIGQSSLKAFENKHIYNYVNQRLFTGNSIDLNRLYTSINGFNDQDRISTNVDDNNWLNRADFVSSFSNKERIFFLFNEYSHIDSFNSDYRNKQRSSYISQICLNDHGAPLNSLRNIWTTYLKSKLSCIYDPINDNTGFVSDSFDPSFHKNTIFHFDELKSISQPYTGSDGQEYFYGVFSTSSNSITASAVCLFTMNQIMESFHGDYKFKEKNDIPYEVPYSSGDSIKKQYYSIPKPRPSECPETLTYQHLVFSRKNFIMEREIQSNAIVIESSASDRFLSISVDYQVSHKNENEIKSDVLYIGTDNGRVLNLVIQQRIENDNKPEMIYSEEINLLNSKLLSNLKKIKTNQQHNLNSKSINGLKMYETSTKKKYLIIVTQYKLLSLSADFCEQKLDSKICDNKLNPYCFWSNEHSKCFNKMTNSDLTNIKIIQSQIEIKTTTNIVNDFENELNVNESISLNNLNDENLNIKSSKIDSNDMTITINIYVLLFLLTLFLILSIVLIVFLFQKMYEKLFKKADKNSINFLNSNKIKECFLNMINNSNNLNNDMHRKNFQISTEQPSPFEISSTISYSSSSSTKSSMISTARNQNNIETRYVSLKANNKPAAFVISNNENEKSENKTNEMLRDKFFDYDDNQYYSLKTKTTNMEMLSNDIKANMNSRSYPSRLSTSNNSTLSSNDNYFTFIKPSKNCELNQNETKLNIKYYL